MIFLFLKFVSSGYRTYLVFSTQHISTIVNKTTNFKCSNITSKAVRNFTLQKNRIMVQQTVSMT